MSELLSRLNYNPYSRLNQRIIDSLICGVFFYLAYQIRFEGTISPDRAYQMWLLMPGMMVGRLALNSLLGIYKLRWRYVSIMEAIALGKSYAAFSLVLVVARLGLPDTVALFRLPLSVISIEFMGSFLSVLSARLVRRLLYQRSHPWQVNAGRVRRLLLLGAGSVGAMVAKEMLGRHDVRVAGYLDDDPQKKGSVVGGAPVYGPLVKLSETVRDKKIDMVVVCMSSIPRDTARLVWRCCDELGVETRIIPPTRDLIDGITRLTSLREIKIEDLLTRPLSDTNLKKDVIQVYQKRRILITGAGGSIGSELTRQMATLRPERLLLLDKDENGLYQLQQEMAIQFPEAPLDFIVRDLRNDQALANLFEHHHPQVVFHAAAHKHVPLMEMNVCEAVLNNVLGSRNVVAHAVKHRAERLVFISTDKAVNPTNVMGATKHIGEMIVQAHAGKGPTLCCCVRFGNVMGSRGSVIPLFIEQIRKGEPLTLSSPEMTRYFITIPEAVQLVIQAGTLANTGEVFVLDMGNPVRILDLARDVIELSGMRPEHDIQIKEVGVRPGEKIQEEFQGDGELVTRTEFEKILKVKPLPFDLILFEKQLDAIEKAAWADNTAEVYQLLHELEIGYKRVKG
ncbi:MAG: polysaccharide biosynthesis protein [Candidatus Binatia bacterium]